MDTTFEYTTSSTWPEVSQTSGISRTNVITSSSMTSKMVAGCALYDLLVCGIIVGVSCLLGLMGNAAAVVVLRADRHHHSLTAFLLTALAAADSAFLLPVAALTVPPAVCRFRPAWCAGEATLKALCIIDQYGWAVASTAHTLTVYVTVLVTWHRYNAVCRPHAAAAALPARTLTVAKRRIGAVVLFAVIYNMPRFFEFHVDVTIEHVYSSQHRLRNVTLPPESTTSIHDLLYHNSSNYTDSLLNSISSSEDVSNGQITSDSSSKIPNELSSKSSTVDLSSFSPTLSSSSDMVSLSSMSSLCSSLSYDELTVSNIQLRTTRVLTDIGRSTLYQVVYKNICFYVLIYVIPLVTLLILTTRLAQALHLRNRRFRSRQASFRSRREDGTTLVLIVVVVVFFVCQTPTLFQRMFYAIFGDAGLKCGHFFFYFEKLADYFAVLNSCVNFIIYIMFSRQFRQVLWTSMRRKRRQTSVALRARAAWYNDQEKLSNGHSADCDESVV